MRSSWERFGRLPAVPVTAAFLVLTAAIMLAVPRSPIWLAPGLVMAVGFMSYCAARPTRRWDTFLLGAMPDGLSLPLHDITGIDRWSITVLLIPLALLWIAREEREEREERAAGRGAGRAAGAVPE